MSDRLLLLFLLISISSGTPTTKTWETTQSPLQEPLAATGTEDLLTPKTERTIDNEIVEIPSLQLPLTTLVTIDHTTTEPTWEATSYFAEDMMLTTVKSKKEMSEKKSTTPSTAPRSPSMRATPPSIDSKDFLSEIAKATYGPKYHEVVTNVKEKRVLATNKVVDPINLPECEDSINSEHPDYQGPDLASSVESAETSHKNRAVDGWSDPTITGSTSTSLTVSWKAPTNNITVLYYVIAWDRNSQPEKSCRSSNETFNHTITDLDPCTTYNVRVTAYPEEGDPHQRVVSDSTGLNISTDTLNLKVSERGTDWLKIVWNLPNNGCVAKYVVTYCDSKNCTHVDSSETSFNATELIPCTKYDFTVAVHGKSGEYGNTNITGETDFLQPGQPSPSWTEAGRKSLRLFWTPPVGFTCVCHYRITLSLDGTPRLSLNHTGSENETTIKDLLSCRVYEVTIVPVHLHGDGLPEVIQSNRTFPEVLSPPVSARDPSTTGHRMLLKWRMYTNEDNNCEDTILYTRCNYTLVLGHGYEGVNATVENVIANGTKSVVEWVQMNNLSPFTMYMCYASAGNSQGISEESSEVSAETGEEVPSPPTHLSASDRTDTQFVLNWKAPEYLPGNLTGFEIKLIWYPNATGPRWCEEPEGTSDTISNIRGNVFTLKYTNATPFSAYKIHIRAMTNAGWGNSSDDVWVETKPGAPGPVSFLNYSIARNIHDPDILDFSLAWGKPCSVHGERIEHYNITAVGERKNFPPDVFTEIVRIRPPECSIDEDTCKKIIKLKEEYIYTFHVSGKVKDYPELGERNSVTAEFPAGIPPLPDTNYTNQISIDPYKARRTTTTATILLPVFPDTNGKIRCYAIIVAKSTCNNMTHSRIDLVNGEWPDTPSWYESMSVDFQIPYQAVKFCDSNPSYIIDYGNLKAVKYILGDEPESCPEFSSNREQRSFCNGPLKPDTWYDVRMRAFTNGGYRDSTIFSVKTNAEMRMAVVIGTIFGILFLGIVTTLMLLVRKCSIQAVLRRFLHSDMPGSPVPAPLTRRKFITHCQQLADNPGKLSNEFQLLQTLSVDLQMPTNAACLQANRKKNRYTDILPYDFSRVKLEQIDTDPNSDYINASFIKGFNGEEEYIACQGPKEETTYDFWRMIDEYDVKLIVMLTQLVEKNKEKCHQYFPIVKETFTYENMSIRCTTEFDYRTYTQRTLVLQKENEKRTITHLHFKDWPDHDVPEDFDPMINFCQIIRRYITANPGLAVVHCSAGIGRTGTLIAIDILLQHIKENRKLDVFGTVYRLRHHRINMVQRESQYAYIYNCIRQVLKNPYFSKTYKPPSVDPITDVSNKKKDPAITNLVSSLETLRKSSLSTSVESAEQIFHSSSSTSSSPKSRNCLSLGIKYSKSTSAICTKPFGDQIVRYNTLDCPVYDIDKSESSTNSLDSDESSHSFYENLHPLHRSKSAHFISEDPTVTEKLLDTSL